MPTRATARKPAAPIPFVASVSPADVLNHILKLHNRLLAPFPSTWKNVIASA